MSCWSICLDFTRNPQRWRSLLKLCAIIHGRLSLYQREHRKGAGGVDQVFPTEARFDRPPKYLSGWQGLKGCFLQWCGGLCIQFLWLFPRSHAECLREYRAAVNESLCASLYSTLTKLYTQTGCILWTDPDRHQLLPVIYWNYCIICETGTHWYYLRGLNDILSPLYTTWGWLLIPLHRLCGFLACYCVIRVSLGF